MLALIALVPCVYLAAVTPALWTTDVDERRLPNRLVLPGYLVAAAAACGLWAATGQAPAVALASGLAYFAFLLVLSLAGGMGMGDVKLGGVLGLAAGLIAPAAAVGAPVIAFAVGGIGALVTLVRGRGGTSIPFGPFMLAGFWGAVALAVFVRL